MIKAFQLTMIWLLLVIFFIIMSVVSSHLNDQVELAAIDTDVTVHVVPHLLFITNGLRLIAGLGSFIFGVGIILVIINKPEMLYPR